MEKETVSQAVDRLCGRPRLEVVELPAFLKKAASTGTAGGSRRKQGKTQAKKAQ